MPKFSTAEALEHLGGSAAQIDRELRSFVEAAKVLSSNHPRMINDHPYKWVAVFEGNVSAEARGLPDLLTKLDKKRVPREKVIIRYIDRQLVYILIGLLGWGVFGAPIR
ncbi:MAG TPA: hypothetical protein VN663_23005 [Ramlibacter sp.]|nr:hypothetical protein [Ramlibacter sp.]